MGLPKRGTLKKGLAVVHANYRVITDSRKPRVPTQHPVSTPNGFGAAISSASCPIRLIGLRTKLGFRSHSPFLEAPEVAMVSRETHQEIAEFSDPCGASSQRGQNHFWPDSARACGTNSYGMDATWDKPAMKLVPKKTENSKMGCPGKWKHLEPKSHGFWAAHDWRQAMASHGHSGCFGRARVHLDGRS